jgi:hypothetical protein
MRQLHFSLSRFDIETRVARLQSDTADNRGHLDFTYPGEMTRIVFRINGLISDTIFPTRRLRNLRGRG